MRIAHIFSTAKRHAHVWLRPFNAMHRYQIGHIIMNHLHHAPPTIDNIGIYILYSKDLTDRESAIFAPKNHVQSES